MGEITKNSNSFSINIDRVLNNTYPISQQVMVRPNTPKAFLGEKAENLPMLITQKHIKSIIYTLEEAKKLKLKVKNINYHGLGKELLVKVIDNLDYPKAIYKKDISNYIIVMEFKDIKNREIIVPIQINAKGNYNDEYINENQIKSVYGRNDLKNYLKTNNFEQIY